MTIAFKMLEKVVPSVRLFYILLLISVGCSAPKKYTYFFDHHQNSSIQKDSAQHPAAEIEVHSEEIAPAIYASSEPQIVVEKMHPTKITLRSFKKLITQKSDSITQGKQPSKEYKKRGAAFAGFGAVILGIVITAVGYPFATYVSMAGIVFSVAGIVLSIIGLKSDRKTIASIGLVLGLGGIVFFLIMFGRSIGDFGPILQSF